MLRSSFYLLILTLFLSACGQDPQSFEGSRFGAGAQSLSGPESERGIACSCAFHYDPVCGVNGLTYTNSCVANCEGVDYRSGECQDGQKACNPSSGHVCAQPPCDSSDCSNGMPHARAYTSECSMMQGGGAFIHKGLCR